MLPRGVVDIDGTLMPAEQATISVFDRGFLYGDSAFEVARTYGKRAFRLREHLERLDRSCGRLRIVLPVALGELERRVVAAVAAAGEPECYLRIVVTRGIGTLGLDLANVRSPSVLIYALQLHVPEARFYEEGIAVGLVQTQRVLDETSAVGAKASNYLASLLALDEVKQRGCQEAVILSASGEVLEGATSNVFAVRRGELHTPEVSAGILEGITRRSVLELARAHGLVVHERTLRPNDLDSADEVFITSSIRELMPVVKVDEAVVGKGTPGPVWARLHAAYRELAWRS
jgi:branched-chain amino acid aminotransferase